MVNINFFRLIKYTCAKIKENNFMFYRLLCITFIGTSSLLASGGYDNGTPAGKGNIDLDFTWNPNDMIEKGQSYVVWGYGLTDSIDFHGYASHEASTGNDQIYWGFMKNFFQNPWVDLSTAYGIRHREGEIHSYFPQLLYTFKLPDSYQIAGSVVNVYNHNLHENLGETYDMALRIPINFSFLPTFIKETKFSLGVFRNAGGTVYPTYSVDFKF